METRAGVILIALVVGAVGLLNLLSLGASLLDGLPRDLTGFVLDIVLAVLLIVAAVGLLREEKWGLVLALLLLTLLIVRGAMALLGGFGLVPAAILGLEVLALVYLVSIRDEFL